MRMPARAPVLMGWADVAGDVAGVGVSFLLLAVVSGSGGNVPEVVEPTGREASDADATSEAVVDVGSEDSMIELGSSVGAAVADSAIGGPMVMLESLDGATEVTVPTEAIMVSSSSDTHVSSLFWMMNR